LSLTEIMECVISIVPQEEGGPRVTLTNCGIRSITTVLPADSLVFDGGNTRGLEGGDGHLTIWQDGTLECRSGETEFDTKLPAAIAQDLFAAFKDLAGNALENPIEVGKEMEEEEENPAVNPNPEGGKKRRSRVKKQTRRSQRKRRNTIRK
jgi:hypothetical protein